MERGLYFSVEFFHYIACLSSTVTYFLSLFEISVKVASTFEKLASSPKKKKKKNLWSGVDEGKRYHIMSRESV